MTIKDVKHDLNFYPQFRERKNKDRYIAEKLEHKYHTEIKIDQLIEIIRDASNLDRNWRLTLQRNPRLRGLDYLEGKDRLEKGKLLELGYKHE